MLRTIVLSIWFSAVVNIAEDTRSTEIDLENKTYRLDESNNAITVFRHMLGSWRSTTCRDGHYQTNDQNECHHH